VADEGIQQLGEYVDSLITIPNEKLISVMGKNTSLLDAFKAANNVLYGAVQGIAELITRPGLINVDFADVRAVMSEMGMAMMGSGSGSGEGRARTAAESAVSSPLLEDVDLAGARGVLVNVTAGPDMSIGEFGEVGDTVREFADANANVVVGTAIDMDMENEMRVTVVATGIGRAPEPEKTVEMPKRKASGDMDYHELDRPTVIRNKAAGDGTTGQGNQGDDEYNYLDIPAFLRRQAD
jgi:cell division protein FtsZ